MNEKNYYFDPFAAKNKHNNQSANPQNHQAGDVQIPQSGDVKNNQTTTGNVQNQNTYYTPYNQPNYGYGYGAAPVLGMSDMADMNKAKQQKKEISHLGTLCGGGILLFTIFSTILSLIIISTNSRAVYESSFFFQSGFYIISSVVSVGFGFYLVSRKTRKTVDTFLPAKPIPILELVMYVIIGLALCRIANSVSSIFVFIVTSFGFELSQGNMISSSSIPQLLFELVSVAVVPGIIEEYAMRGTVLQPLKKHGVKFAVFATACVFGFMHGNLIQAPFAFMVGIVLAVITIKTESIVPAMIIHFANNANSVLTGYLANNVSEGIASSYFMVSMVVVMILATASFIFMVVKNSKNPSRIPVFCGTPKVISSPYELTEWQKFRAFISSPAMIIAIFLMILNTTQYVSYTGMRGV